MNRCPFGTNRCPPAFSLSRRCSLLAWPGAGTRLTSGLCSRRLDPSSGTHQCAPRRRRTTRLNAATERRLRSSRRESTRRPAALTGTGSSTICRALRCCGASPMSRPEAACRPAPSRFAASYLTRGPPASPSASPSPQRPRPDYPTYRRHFPLFCARHLDTPVERRAGFRCLGSGVHARRGIHPRSEGPRPSLSLRRQRHRH